MTWSGGESGQTAEFDTAAEWTAEAVAALGSRHALPAATRGSGGPAVLRWLGDAMAPTKGRILLDVGAGMGGTAQWAREKLGVRPVLVEPEPGACHAAAQLFGLPQVRATGQHLPIPDTHFPLVWSLGVLCTGDQQSELVAEMTRVLSLGGRLAMMVLVTTNAAPLVAETGNHFPTDDLLWDMVRASGLRIRASRWGEDLAPGDQAWRAAQAAVEHVVHEQHVHHPAYQRMRHQERVLADLLHAGVVRRRLLVAERAGRR